MRCACGCQTEVTGVRRGKPIKYVSGHNLSHQGPRTEQHRARIAEGQRRAWLTKRTRKPLGSRRVSASGYVVVKVEPGQAHWKPEHVLMVEEAIGRRLRPGEHVHHINAIKTDNRMENLHLFTTRAEHTAAHGSLNVLLDPLLRESVLAFDRETGRYKWSRTTAIRM